MTGIGFQEFLAIGFLLIVIVLIFGSIVKKAGFSRWWSLLMIIPLVNLIMIWVFAFMPWPAEKKAP